MKSIYALTILIGATAKPISHKNEQSVARPIAGLRGQHKDDSNKQRDLQGLFGDFEDFLGIGDFFGGDNTDYLSGGDAGFSSCGETCTDSALCTSFTNTIDPTPLFKDACNAGCFPKTQLSTCEDYCVDDDAASTAAAITAVERLGMFDSMVDVMCSDCKFYQCCIGNDAAANPTKYDACMQFLDDDVEEQAMGNSVLDQIANAFDSITDIFEDIGIPAGDGSDGDLDSILDQIADSVTEALDSLTEALDAVDLPELDWNFTDNVWGDSTDASGTDQMASGLSVLGELVDSIACPETCADKDLCGIVFMGTTDNSFLEDACNAGCLPTVSSCDEICGNVDGLEFMESAAAMACESCNFFECCGEDKDSETQFDDCKKFMPEMSFGSTTNTPTEDSLSDSSASSADIPAEVSLSEPSGSAASTSEDSILSESNESPEGTPAAEITLSESSDSSTSTPAQDSLSEPLESPIVPLQSATFEVSRVTALNSGPSNSTQISMLIASLASIATLFFASF